MEQKPFRSTKRVLDPSERIAEVLFGLIMVLTFTGALSVAEADQAEVKIMLIGAIGCNLAWGIIDALFYLMGSFAEKGHALKIYRSVRESDDKEKANEAIVDALPNVVASVMEPSEIEQIRNRLMELPDVPEQAHLSRDDYVGAIGVFLLVFLATFPVVIPFIFVEDVATAMRYSNLIAVAMLVLLGYAYGRYVGRRPWLTGFAMLIVGAVIVAMTIALGG